jgi:hypothetical protein
MKQLFLAVFLLLTLTGAPAADTLVEKVTPGIGKPAPGFTLPDKDGNRHSLEQYRGSYVVLEWTNPDCPFVKKHYLSKNMQKLQKKYTSKKVIWLSICSSAKGKQGYYTGKALKKRLKEYAPSHTAYLTDSDGTVGRLYGAKTTPHIFIIDTAGLLLYAGGIDNRPSTQQEDIAGATNYVAAALDAVLAGKKISIPVTKPYGCSVKY